MLKKFKSLFIIEDENPSKEQSSEVHESTGTQETQRTAAYTTTNSTGGQGAVQDKFLEVLFGALEANNQEGFDYMEFKDFFNSLAKVPMDDATRYKSAFATAATMGATKEKIINSARHYMSVLEKEQSKFQDALEGQKQRNLTGKQDEIKNLEKSIQEKGLEIERLKKEMDAHRELIGKLEQEINAASEKLTDTAADFSATYKSLLGQIESDVKNIETHL